MWECNFCSYWNLLAQSSIGQTEPNVSLMQSGFFLYAYDRVLISIPMYIATYKTSHHHHLLCTYPQVCLVLCVKVVVCSENNLQDDSINMNGQDCCHLITYTYSWVLCSFFDIPNNHPLCIFEGLMMHLIASWITFDERTRRPLT